MPFDLGLAESIAFGMFLGFTAGSFVAYLALRSLALEMLAHPTVQAMVRVANKYAGKGGGMLEGIARKALKFFFG